MRFWLLVSGMLVAGRALALDPQKAMTQFTHRHWGAADGISMVFSMAQTTNGYLWLSTTRGIYRFDGIHFVRTGLDQNQPRMVENPPTLLATRDGSLWINRSQTVVRLWKDN